MIQEIMLEAIKRDIPTAVDLKFDNFWAYKHATLFKPNLREIQARLPFRAEAELASLRKAAGHIREKLGNPYTLLDIFLDTEYAEKTQSRTEA